MITAYQGRKYGGYIGLFILLAYFLGKLWVDNPLQVMFGGLFEMKLFFVAAIAYLGYVAYNAMKNQWYLL